MSREQIRIFLWCYPRSVSSAFFRAMMNRENIEVLFEPYGNAYHYGSEFVGKRFASEPVMKSHTFKDIKALCEQAYSGKAEIFVKDMAFHLIRKENFAELLPVNYKHTFLIRNPEKSIQSLYTATVSQTIPGFEYFDPSEVGIKEQFQMMVFITKECGQEAVIIDADDLVTYPEDVLRQYCSKVGIDFQEKMIKWEHPVKNMKPFGDWIPWIRDMLDSQGFYHHSSNASTCTHRESLPKDVQDLIKEAMPYYENMYKLRLRPKIH